MRQHPPKPEIGERTRDGIYLGRFFENYMERDYYADVSDARDSTGQRLALTFNEAAAHAKTANALGYTDWILPPGFKDKDDKPDILDVLYKNRGTIGGFAEEGTYPSSWYRASSEYGFKNSSARIQKFGNGDRTGGFKDDKLSVRLVRRVPVV